jgi:hypothetical protein
VWRVLTTFTFVFKSTHSGAVPGIARSTLVYANPLQALAAVRERVRPQADAIAHTVALFSPQILSGWPPVIFARAEVPYPSSRNRFCLNELS